MSGSERVDAVVVGAGFAGMYMLYRLRELGLTTVVFEAGSGVGGTWYWNRYPGARCDVESLQYSYSFSPDLEQEWEWTERYPTQPEILRYADHVADRFDLRRDIRFETSVVAAVFDEVSKRWTISTDQRDELTAQFCIMATGCLSVPKQPEAPGLETFAGPTYHTGRWPHEGVDLTGQRVGVIGTGSSGIQSIPLLAEQAADLTVFQRTANYSFPALNAPLVDGVQEAMKAAYPAFRQAARESRAGIPLEPPTKSVFEDDDDERRRTYEACWGRGTLVAIGSSYIDVMLDEKANDTAAEFVRNKVRSIVKDADVAEILAPKSHPLGTKRPCLDTNYYATFNRDDVHLVDLQATPIVEVIATGLRTTEREYEFDVLVFATGFDAMTGALTRIDIRGRDGESLKEKWMSGPRTYLGLSVAGFPNLFTITGPGSPSVLSNMMVSIEQHVEWIAGCIAYMRDRGLATIEADAAAEDAWVDHVRTLGEFTLFPKANSWYMGANVPGKPRVFMPYVGGVGEYRRRCDEVAAQGYEGYILAG